MKRKFQFQRIVQDQFKNMCTDFVTLSSLNKCQVQLFSLNILKLEIKQRIKTLTHQVLGVLEEIGD